MPDPLQPYTYPPVQSAQPFNAQPAPPPIAESQPLHPPAQPQPTPAPVHDPAAAARIADGSLPFTLNEPVEVGGVVYKVVNIQRAKAKHLRAMDLVSGGQTKEMALTAALCGLSFGVVEEMAMDDYLRLSRMTRMQMGNEVVAAIAASRAAADED